MPQEQPTNQKAYEEAQKALEALAEAQKAFEAQPPTTKEGKALAEAIKNAAEDIGSIIY
jgi:hypothetical protein